MLHDIRLALRTRHKNPSFTAVATLTLAVDIAAWLTVAGANIGLVIAFVSARPVNALLFGVQATDVTTYAGVLLAVTPLVVLAAAIPAWRASRTDPLRALRNE
jgi:putative ABC transport system permease protein